MKRRSILLIISVLFIWLVVSRFTELQQLKDILTQGNWSWVLAAVFSQIMYFMVFTSSYQAAFDTIDIHTRTRDQVPLVLGSLFINVIVPAGGAGGAALFTEDLARRGIPAGRVATGILLQLTADFSAFILVLIPGTIFLYIQHDLKFYEILAAVILICFTLVLGGILLIGMRKPARLRTLFDWSQRTAGWIFGRFNRSLALASDWAERNAQEFNNASEAISQHPLRLFRTIITAFAAHLLDIATLYLLFLAFNQKVSLGQLVAGYAVGILFWIVSFTPQGIGIVEGMMALVFTSLGIPGAVATAVSLAFRGLTFWLPMILGFFAVQQLRAFGTNQRTQTETWGVRFTAILVAFMGILNVISAITPSLSVHLAVLENYSPFTVRHGGHLTAALTGFALLALARNLGRRKRVAWLLTLIVLCISAVSHLIKGPDYVEALLAAGLAVLLWVMRYHFHARSDRPSIQQGLRLMAGALLFTLAYGVLGFYLLDHHYSINFGFWAAVRQTIIMFTQFYDPGLVPITHFGRFFAGSIYVIGAVTFSFAGLMLLRPVLLRQPATNEERSRARKIVEKYGHSSLAYFVLFNDKSYYFTPGGSVIGYAKIGRTAVVLGDPIGPDTDLLPAIQSFKSFSQENDWLPVFYQTEPGTLEQYKQAGFEAICIGDEGIVNLNAFSLEGKSGKPLRTPMNRLVKSGHIFKILQPPIPDPILAELRAISDEWLTTMHGTEKRFSLGWFEDDYIRSTPIGAVYTADGWISAFANVVPEFKKNNITIDLMRRRREVEPGTMEFLFVSLFLWAREQDYEGFDLGLSGLAGVGEKQDDPAVERFMHFIYENINQFYNFKGLHEFKEKFQPVWSPRYLIFPSSTTLAQAWLAVMRANSGEIDISNGMLTNLRRLTK